MVYGEGEGMNLLQCRVILSVLGMGSLIVISIGVAQIFATDKGPREGIIFQASLIATLCFITLALLEVLKGA